MVKYIHIGPKNKTDVGSFKSVIKSGGPIAVLFYMEGCGPCNAARPEWKKLGNATGLPAGLVVFEIDQELLGDLTRDFPKLGGIAGFPNMKFIRGPSNMSDYEGERTIDHFVRWIQSQSSGGGRPHQGGRRRRRGRRTRRRIKRTHRRGARIWSRRTCGH